MKSNNQHNHEKKLLLKGFNTRATDIKSQTLAALNALHRTAARLTYQAAYIAALTLPGTRRQRKARARRLAAKAEANAQKHAPAAIALALNGLVLFLIGTVRFREDTPRDKTAITAVVDNDGFFTRTAPTPEPPAGGGGGGGSAAAVAAQAAKVTVSVQLETPSLDIAALTTSAAATSFSVTTPTASPTGLGDALAKGTGSGSGSGQGTGQGDGSGSGSGIGNGSGSGIGEGSGSGIGRGAGEGKRITSIRSLEGWDLIVLVDQSNMVGDAGGYDDSMLRVRTHQFGKYTFPTKINAKLLPNILAQRNSLIEVVSCWDDNMFPENSEGRTYTDLSGWHHTFPDLGHGAFATLPRYKGRANTAIIIGSEFQWQAKEVSKEEQERVEKFLLDLDLPIFMISLGARPDNWHRQVARKSGGTYLGYISANNAKSMAKDVESIWTPLISTNGELIYERRNAPEVKSEKILAEELEDSKQEGLSEEESTRRARNNKVTYQ